MLSFSLSYPSRNDYFKHKIRDTRMILWVRDQYSSDGVTVSKDKIMGKIGLTFCES